MANRTERARYLANDIHHGLLPTVACSLDGLTSYLGTTDILINTTSLGMHPEIDTMPPVDFECLPPAALVCDIVYNPKETRLIQRAAACGLATLPGLGMLAYQGAAALEIWLQVKAPVEVMKATLWKQLFGEVVANYSSRRGKPCHTNMTGVRI